MVRKSAAPVTLRRQWLGRQLRQLREDKKLTLDAPAEFLQRTTATVSRVEAGIYPIRRPDVLALLDLYHVTDTRQREGLLRMSEDAWQSGWWDGYADEFDQWFVDFVWLEEQAVEHRLFDNALLPGLLQTEDYARALNRAGISEATDGSIERLVELRMNRQSLLNRDDPPAVRCIIDEAVLHRPVGGTGTMEAQFRYLIEQTYRSAIQMRVLTFTGAASTVPTGAIKLYEMVDPYPDVAYVETPKGGVYIEEPDTDSVAEQYDRIWESALSEKDSVEFISTLIEESQ